MHQPVLINCINAVDKPELACKFFTIKFEFFRCKPLEALKWLKLQMNNYLWHSVYISNWCCSCGSCRGCCSGCCGCCGGGSGC